MSEAQDPYCLTAEQADGLLSGAPWRRFVVVGDSLAKGLGEDSPGYEPLSWADRTAAVLRRAQPDLEYLNLGVERLRAAEVRAGQLQAAVDFRPDLAGLVCGGNDLLQEEFDAPGIEAELDAIIAGLRETGAEVFTFTLQDITKAYTELAESHLSERIESLNDLVRKVSERHGAMVVETWGHPGQSNKATYSSDLMHASWRGHAVIGAETIRRLGERLGN